MAEIENDPASKESGDFGDGRSDRKATTARVRVDIAQFPMFAVGTCRRVLSTAAPESLWGGPATVTLEAVSDRTGG